MAPVFTKLNYLGIEPLGTGRGEATQQYRMPNSASSA
jgi:hypothetical protein